MKEKNNILVGTGLLTAFSASLCCIAPLLAVISGASGMASTFSWIEPVRPYLLGFTIVTLGIAWLQKLKPVKMDDCGCEIKESTPFIQSKKFLALVTIFAFIMMLLPYYSHIFYQSNSASLSIDKRDLVQVTFEIEGMTCQGCEEHITHEVEQVKGVGYVEASYDEGSAVVQFDKSITSLDMLKEAVGRTGYTIKSVKE